MLEVILIVLAIVAVLGAIKLFGVSGLLLLAVLAAGGYVAWRKRGFLRSILSHRGESSAGEHEDLPKPSRTGVTRHRMTALHWLFVVGAYGGWLLTALLALGLAVLDLKLPAAGFGLAFVVLLYALLVRRRFRTVPANPTHVATEMAFGRILWKHIFSPGIAWFPWPREPVFYRADVRVKARLDRMTIKMVEMKRVQKSSGEVEMKSTGTVVGLTFGVEANWKPDLERLKIYHDVRNGPDRASGEAIKPGEVFGSDVPVNSGLTMLINEQVSQWIAAEMDGPATYAELLATGEKGIAQLLVELAPREWIADFTRDEFNGRTYDEVSKVPADLQEFKMKMGNLFRAGKLEVPIESLGVKLTAIHLYERFTPTADSDKYMAIKMHEELKAKARDVETRSKIANAKRVGKMDETQREAYVTTTTLEHEGDGKIGAISLGAARQVQGGLNLVAMASAAPAEKDSNDQAEGAREDKTGRRRSKRKGDKGS